MLSLLLLAVLVPAQADSGDYSPRYVENTAFGPGERLVFSVEYGIIKAGTATMSVTGPEQYQGLMAYRISASARSNPAFSGFFRVDDLNEALLDVVQLHTLRFYKRLEEGDYSHAEEVLFDQDAGTATYPDEEDPARQVYEIPPHALDVLSCLYYARTLPLVVGDSYVMDCHTDKGNYPLQINVLQQERIRVPAGTFDCVLVEPQLRGESIFDQRGRILVWLTDDESHMPVLMRSEIVIGEIACLLESYTQGTVIEVPDPFHQQ